ncbi:MAG: hypothetical protein LBP22_03730 [Deltaproteobacteria bacterium]|nr:hypothetical protein [Deltaproteobacteria bacterium]
MLVIGRHSGQGAVRLKCLELGLDYPPEKLKRLLGRVRIMAASLERSLYDDEFLALAGNSAEA